MTTTLLCPPSPTDSHLTLNSKIVSDFSFTAKDVIPIRVAVIGKQKQGKSTLLNQLFGVNFDTGDIQDIRDTKGCLSVCLVPNPAHPTQKLICTDSEGIVSEDRIQEGRDAGFSNAIVRESVTSYSQKQMAMLAITHNTIIFVFKDFGSVMNDLENLAEAVRVIRTATTTVKPKLIIVWNSVPRKDLEHYASIMAAGKTPVYLSNVRSSDFGASFASTEMICLPNFIDNNSGDEIPSLRSEYNFRLSHFKKALLSPVPSTTVSTEDSALVWVNSFSDIVKELNASSLFEQNSMRAKKEASKLLKTASDVGFNRFMLSYDTSRPMTEADCNSRLQAAITAFKAYAPVVNTTLIQAEEDSLKTKCLDKWMTELQVCDAKTSFPGCSHTCALPKSHTSGHNCNQTQTTTCSGDSGFTCSSTGTIYCADFKAGFMCKKCHAQCPHLSNCLVAGKHTEHRGNCCCIKSCVYHSKQCILHSSSPHTSCKCENCCPFSCACNRHGHRCVLDRDHNKKGTACTCQEDYSLNCTYCGKTFTRRCGSSDVHGCFLSGGDAWRIADTWRLGDGLLIISINPFKVIQGGGGDKGVTDIVEVERGMQFNVPGWYNHGSTFKYIIGSGKIIETQWDNGHVNTWTC